MSITPFPTQGQYPWYDQLEQWGADTQAAAESAELNADGLRADVATALADSTAASAAAIAAAGLVDAPAGAAVDAAISEGGAAFNTLKAQVSGAFPYVDMLTEGATADGVTNDFPVFQAARTKAGSKGVVHFRARQGASETVYFLAGVRPDLSGTQITADPSVVLKMDANPNVKAWGLLTPLTVENTAHLTTLRKMSGSDLPLAAAAAANVRPQPVKITAIDFTTWTELSIDAGTLGPYTPGTLNATIVSDKVSWATNVGHVIAGIVAPVILGALQEAAIQYTWNSPTSWGGVTLLSADNHVINMTVTETSANISGSTDFAATTSVPIDDYHALTSMYGGVQLGYRIVTPRLIELYSNGRKVHTLTTLKDVVKAGWAVNNTDMAAKSIVAGITYTDVPTTAYRPADSQPLTVSVVGDSISYGAWSGITWPELLPIATHGLPGLGSVTVRQNLAVSGTSAQQWATPAGAYDIAAKDFTGDDYVLVMLGTNDVQASRAAVSYKADLTVIANKIVADGAVPVFGMFPFWTSRETTGVGVTTTNPRGGSVLRAVVANFAAANGYPLALVRDAIGTNWTWLADNIHPDEIGQATIAKAFAQAMSRHRTDFA